MVRNFGISPAKAKVYGTFDLYSFTVHTPDFSAVQMLLDSQGRRQHDAISGNHRTDRLIYSMKMQAGRWRLNPMNVA